MSQYNCPHNFLPLSSGKNPLFLSRVNALISDVSSKLAQSNALSLKEYQLLLKRLDKASDYLAEIESFSAASQPILFDYATNLRKQLISFYSQIDSAYLAYLIKKLELSTLSLKNQVYQKQKKGLIKKMNGIHEQIRRILETFLPSFKERRSLVHAKLMLEEAEQFLIGKHRFCVAVFEQTFNEIEALLEEIADYLSCNNFRAVQKIMQSVTDFQRKILIYYLEPKDLLTNVLHNIERSAHQNIRVAS